MCRTDSKKDQLKAEKLTIVFEVPISSDNEQFEDNPEEHAAYHKQREWLHKFAADRPCGTQMDEDGVQLMTQFNQPMREVLPLLLEQMSLFAGVEVTHWLMESMTWDDVVDHAEDGLRLMTDAECQEYYEAQPYFNPFPQCT